MKYSQSRTSLSKLRWARMLQFILETLLSNSKITVFNLQVYHGIYFQVLLLPLLNYLSVYEYDE